MEETIIDDAFSSGGELTVDAVIKHYLETTSKWAKFLAIVGFVFCGLLVLMALFIGSILGYLMGSAGAPAAGIPLGMFTIIYLIIAGVWFMPFLYLFRFSTATKRALMTNNQEELIKSFQNLKSHYQFVGILTAIGLGFYVLMIFFAIIAGM